MPKCPLFLSTAFPLVCSGDIYAAVPRMTPCWVAAWLSVGEFERFISACSPQTLSPDPKSNTFTFPSGVTLIFAGFKSRWMTPFSCAASRASAIWRANFSDSSTGIGPRLTDPPAFRLPPIPGLGSLFRRILPVHRWLRYWDD